MAKKIRYVDMAIWIDETIYSGNIDEERTFKYLYDLCYVLSYKQNYFQNTQDYDSFCIYAATCAYMRLTNPKQFLADDDPKKIKKIKSVLNFIKRILYPAKVNYQNDWFNKVIKPAEDPKSTSLDLITSETRDKIAENNQAMITVEFVDYIKSICKTIKRFLGETPYSNNKKIISNIYISCLLTILRSITLNGKNVNRLFTEDGEEKNNYLDSYSTIYATESLIAPVAYHLEDEMAPYIAVLSNKIKNLIASDMRSIIESYEPDDELLAAMLMNPYNNKGENDD